MLLDKKGHASVEELRQCLKQNLAECNNLMAIADVVLATKELQVGRLLRVEVCGGKNGKCDVLLVGSEKRVPFSLKVGHKSAERRQAHTWDGVSKKFTGWGFDISSLERAYQTMHDKTSSPKRRYSKEPGDWTPGLRAHADASQLCELKIMQSIANKTCRFDRRRCAEGIADAYCGGEPEIILVYMDTGVVQRLNRKALVKKFDRAFKCRRITFGVRSSGRTNHLSCMIGGEEFLYICSTVAAYDAPGYFDPYLCLIRPQTSFIPKLDVLLKPQPRAQRTRTTRRTATSLPRKNQLRSSATASSRGRCRR